MVRVSVCMATYNGERFIKDQIASIIPQLGEQDELVISDDSSVDKTVEIIKEFNDGRIRIYENQKFNSASRNFEFVINQSKGNILFLCDQDDIWLSNKLDIMMKELDNCDLVVSDCKILGTDGSLFPETFFNIYKSGAGLVKNCIKNTFLGNCMAFRREVLIKSLPIPNQVHEMPNLDHGMWIGIISNMFHKVHFIPNVLLYYRRHDANVSPTEVSAKSPYSLFLILQSRFYLISYLMKRFLKYM